MKTINKDDYYKQFTQVSVNGMVMSNTSKCHECDDKLQSFTVFVGAGQRMSTMYSSCCDDCLSIVVKKAIKDGRKTAEEQISRAEQKLYQESLEYVRKIKLQQIS